MKKIGINTGSRRKPFTLREWWLEHLADAAFRRPKLHTKKGAERYREEYRQKNEAHAAIIKAFGITVNGDKMINQPIAP